VAPDRQHSKADAVEILGISLKTLEREMKAGNIGVVRIGRRVFFTDAQLAAYQDAHTFDVNAAV
jgi:predicted site-specific integrase-resolvase